jgi:hypothetical protein
LAEHARSELDDLDLLAAVIGGAFGDAVRDLLSQIMKARAFWAQKFEQSSKETVPGPGSY